MFILVDLLSFGEWNLLPMRFSQLFSSGDSSERPSISTHTFPIVEGGDIPHTSRIARVQEAEDLGNNQFRLRLLTTVAEGSVVEEHWMRRKYTPTRKPTEITVTVRGDIRSKLQDGNVVYINSTSVVPKVDDFSKRPPRRMSWEGDGY